MKLITLSDIIYLVLGGQTYRAKASGLREPRPDSTTKRGQNESGATFHAGFQTSGSRSSPSSWLSNSNIFHFFKRSTLFVAGCVGLIIWKDVCVVQNVCEMKSKGNVAGTKTNLHWKMQPN